MGAARPQQVREVVAASACRDLKGPRWNKLHPLTKKFLKALKILKLRPHDAQTAVADTSARLGTGVDLVCLDERGRHVLVEIKCGFGGYLDRGTGRMRAELSKFGNSPRWQHQVRIPPILKFLPSPTHFPVLTSEGFGDGTSPRRNLPSHGSCSSAPSTWPRPKRSS